MSTKKPIDERIAEAQAKLEQAKNQLKRLENTQKETERKARTHRLVERGAMLESMVDGADTLTNEQIKTVLAAALNSEAAIEIIISMQENRQPEPATGREAALGVVPAGGTQQPQGAGA